MKKDKYGFELTIQRRLFLLGTWWNWNRDWYVYNWNFRLNEHPFYKVWHRSQFVRDLQSAWWNYKYRTWVRFADKNRLWVNVDQKFIEQRKNWDIWPKY